MSDDQPTVEGRPALGALLWLRNHFDTLGARTADLEERGLVPENVKAEQRALRADVLSTVDLLLEAEDVRGSDTKAFRDKYRNKRQPVKRKPKK